jgi:hypothetical protein
LGLGLWLAALPHAATAGMIFSGQNFQRAQSQNCETKKHTPAPRKTGGDSGVEITDRKSL